MKLSFALLVTSAVAVSIFLAEPKFTARAQAFHPRLRSANLVNERDFAKAKDTSATRKDVGAYGELLEEAETTAKRDELTQGKVYLEEKAAQTQLKSNSFVEKLESARQRMSESNVPFKYAKRRLKGKKECPSGTVRCGNAWNCISTSWICDGFDDCGDNWDEQNCCEEVTSTPNVPCGWSEWSEWTQCNTGCNAGLRQRNRTCLCQDGGCKGESTELEECPDYGCFPEADSGCGTRVIKGGTHRIVGGEKTAKGAWPWQALLIASEEIFVCGGTLVGPRHVITAAHCFLDVPIANASFAWNWKVYFGKQDLTLEVGAGETVSAVEKLIIHENYDSNTTDNDIAMMILAEEQSPSNTINFACLDLDHSKHFNSSSNCFSTGWGKTSANGSAASQLQEAKTPLVDRATCNQPHSYGGVVTNNMLCAGITAGGVGTCNGDSGGPLVCSAKDSDSDVGRWYLVGVTSFGVPCALPNYPGVYVDVSKYTGWIQNQINCS